jgi:uncharacterized RDD family membrane protein YckC|tara:strand:- start:4 stop:591 length:588 start_codon:yes stop_codon:yes gene_type:complete
MKKMKNAFYIIVGGLMIIFSLKSIIIDGSEEYAKIIGLLIFGLIFIYPSLKKDSKTASENFIEESNIKAPIWWKRLIGFLIDFIIISFVYTATILIIADQFNVRLDKLYNGLVLFSPFYIFYYSLQEYLYQTTIGKSIVKLKVVSVKSDEKPTFFQILTRSLSRLVFFIDVWFFFFKRPTGLHDIVSKTIVINKK